MVQALYDLVHVITRRTYLFKTQTIRNCVNCRICELWACRYCSYICRKHDSNI